MLRAPGAVELERGELGAARPGAQPVEPVPDGREERLRIGGRTAGQGGQLVQEDVREDAQPPYGVVGGALPPVGGEQHVLPVRAQALPGGEAPVGDRDRRAVALLEGLAGVDDPVLLREAGQDIAAQAAAGGLQVDVAPVGVRGVGAVEPQVFVPVQDTVPAPPDPEHVPLAGGQFVDQDPPQGLVVGAPVTGGGVRPLRGGEVQQDVGVRHASGPQPVPEAQRVADRPRQRPVRARRIGLDADDERHHACRVDTARGHGSRSAMAR